MGKNLMEPLENPKRLLLITISTIGKIRRGGPWFIPGGMMLYVILGNDALLHV